MKVYDAAAIRNVAVVGHGGCGKTQLVSAMLFVAGAVNRLGKVDEGTTVTDFDEEEIARKHTLSSSLAYAEWQNTNINLIDTPGSANFLSDATAPLRVAECALGCGGGAAADSGKVTESDVPGEFADRAKEARDQLIEMVAEADEQLMEAFFAEGTLTQDQLAQGLRTATLAGKIFPLVCTSGLHAIGIQPV